MIPYFATWQQYFSSIAITDFMIVDSDTNEEA